MRLLHIADTHIGKRIHGFPMLEDQRHALSAVCRIAQELRADAVLVAGDLYDKSVPSGTSTSVLDEFFTVLSGCNIPVFLITGNHDSAERLAFGSRLFAHSGVHISAMFEGELRRVTLTDEHGDVHITLLPYVSPAAVRPYFPAATIQTHHDAVREILSHTHIDTAARNILLAHQNVTEYPPSANEAIVGMLDNVHHALFDAYDYVALGHIHQRYAVGRETVRYAGSLHTTAFSDAQQERGITMIDCGAKGDIHTRFVPIVPLHGFRVIKGPIDALLLEGRSHPSDDLFHAVLTDEDDVPDAMARLRGVYPNMLHLTYHNTRTQTAFCDLPPLDRAQTPTDLLAQFATFFRAQNGRDLDEAGIDLLRAHLREMEEE